MQKPSDEVVKQHNQKRIKNQLLMLLIIVVVLVILNFIVQGKLLTTMNIKIVLSHAVFPALVAFGMNFVNAGGIIDLSVGSNVLLSAAIGGVVVTRFSLGYPGLIVAPLISSVLMVLIVVTLVVILHIPAWISSLSMALVFEAIFAVYASQQSSTTVTLDKGYRVLGNWPWPTVILIIAFIIAYILFNRTNIGINIRAIGGNTEVAKAMGINRLKTIYIAAIISGLFIGAAAIYQISYVGRMDSVTGLSSLSLIFQALATVLLAGSLSKIFSGPVGILVGAIFVATIFNMLTLLKVPSGTGQEILLGVIVIVTGIASNYRNKGVVK